MRKGFLVVFLLLIIFIAFIYPHYIQSDTDSMTIGFLAPFVDTLLIK